MKSLINQIVTNNMFLQKIYRRCIWGIDEFRNILGFYDSEAKLAADNQDYWTRDYSNPNLAQDAHWKNNGRFEDHQRWLDLGKEHLDLIVNFSSIIKLQLPVKQIVEWGCGGGANAVHLAPLTEKFIGIDITSESLVECNKQVLEIGCKNFHPILINSSTPESVLRDEINEVDLFICTYVYELFPSPTYGLTVLKLANKMLKAEGVALVHIRYNDGKTGLRSKRWGYKLHPYVMTTYTIEEFWEKSKELGFEPLGIHLKPQQPLVNDHNYAYFFLKKNVVN
jgi:2-polyprenyl-3-methyl-5-hydroxy-6-metoxy-1,4-benzoquinol methylase